MCSCAAASVATLKQLLEREPGHEHVLYRLVQAQQQAKDQFSSTLEEFKSITGYTGGDLERRYNRLQEQADRSKARAGAVSSKIESIERIASPSWRPSSLGASPSWTRSMSAAAWRSR